MKRRSLATLGLCLLCSFSPMENLFAHEKMYQTIFNQQVIAPGKCQLELATTQLPFNVQQIKSVTLNFKLECPEGQCSSLSSSKSQLTFRTPLDGAYQELELLSFMYHRNADNSSDGQSLRVDVTKYKSLFVDRFAIFTFSLEQCQSAFLRAELEFYLQPISQ
ncbi:MAG: hypothetical protein HQK50_18040 [Oligoflexia bacterium]|nr:hypothetical protein [Oligoflexia bacterium]MBF0367480.1 hypothetical protein [Oligoflexia bacterium]